jgi:hypothetical protein
MFRQGLVSMKKEFVLIVQNRTKNRERCSWLKRLRRIGGIDLREFGILAMYLRYKWCLHRNMQVAITRGVRLFNKNTGPCYPAMVCIGADFCSLQVG